ncbi:MAG: hypothetical protein KBH78_04490 [Candidatus Hydrogenedentes bacterium]|nr:hypothetical protein [Candidatus Hydrogenedentota bacterium]
MDGKERKRPWWQWLLAAAGVIYLLGGIGWAVYHFAVSGNRSQGPSELAIHPEKAGEIMARDRAQQLRERLGLSDEQTEQVTRILKEGAEGPPGPETMRRVMEQVRSVLTPEQQQQLGTGPGALGPPPGMPGPPGGGRRGGPGWRMDPDRLEALKEHVPPEMRERFEQRVQEMKERRARWRERGPGMGPGAPMGPPPGNGMNPGLAGPPPDMPPPSPGEAPPGNNPESR